MLTRFEAEHRFAKPPDAVVRVLADPAFYRDLRLPDLELLEARSEPSDDWATSVLVRYEFVGDLHPLARQLLGGERLTWAQALRIDPAGRGGSLSFASETKPEMLHGAATFTLRPVPTAPVPDSRATREGTVRALTGDIEVALPVIGGTAERVIAAGIVARLDVEAEALTRVLGP